ncbi:hypothetical protein RP20_CCG011550 [Aedes albopictus]|nr:hypothetical protein RP20_CCG011550 [Aedes albopictus]
MEESQQLHFPGRHNYNGVGVGSNNNNKPLNVSGGANDGQLADSGYTSYHSSINASCSVARSVLATIEEDNEADSSFEEARSSEDIFQFGGSNVLTPTTAASIERISNFHLTTPNSTGKPVAVQHRALVRKPTFENLFEQCTPKKAGFGSTGTPVRSERKLELGSQTPRKNKASAKRKLGEFREKLYSDGDARELAASGDLNDSLEGACKKLDQEDISPIYHAKRRRNSVIDLIRSSTPKTASLRSNFHVEARENIDWDAVQQEKAMGGLRKSRALRKFQSFSPSKMHSYKKRDALQEKSVLPNGRAPFQRQDAFRQISIEQDFSKQSTPRKSSEISLDASFELLPEILATPTKQANMNVLLDAPILLPTNSEAALKTLDLEQQISQIPSFQECSYPQTPSKQTLSLDDSGVIRHAPVCTELNKSIPSILGTESPSFVSLNIPKTPTSANKSRTRLKRLSSTKKDKPRSKPPSPIHRAQPFIPGSHRRSYENVECLNILKRLNEHDKDALGIVLDYLTDSDLVQVVAVSRGWRAIIKHHQPSFKRLRAHLAREAECKENLDRTVSSSREFSLLGKTGASLISSSFGDLGKEISGTSVVVSRQPFSLCNSIDGNHSTAAAGELRRSGSVQKSPPVSPSKRKFRENQKKNLANFSQNMSSSTRKSRTSFIECWRDKIAVLRDRNKLSTNIEDIEKILSGFSDSTIEDDIDRQTYTIHDCNDQIEPPGQLVYSELALDQEQTNITFQTAVEQPAHQEDSLRTNEFALALCPSAPPEESVQSEVKPLFEAQNRLVQITKEYVHTDDEAGLVFYEKKFIAAESVAKQQPLNGHRNASFSSQSTALTLPPLDYDTDVLRAELTNFGEPPGPITKHTKKLYLKKLVKYKRDPERALAQIKGKLNFSVELLATIRSEDVFSKIPQQQALETEMSSEFITTNDKTWREGHLKKSFIYLLIDPRVSENLPAQQTLFQQHDLWKRFLQSIFYVGKGKSSRPYCHLYDAMKLYQQNSSSSSALKPPPNGELLELQVEEEQIIFQSEERIERVCRATKILNRKQMNDSAKLNRIIDIWRAQRGVICLHVFHNIMPAEAFTREAAIIDALGVQNLTNLKRGDYYGKALSWPMKRRKQLGILLLYKALLIYLAEGETQLLPSTIVPPTGLLQLVIASHLKKSERLKPCPRCEKPSRVVLNKSSIKLAISTGSLDSSTVRTVANGKLDRSYTLPESLGSSASSMIAATALDCTSTTISSPQSPTNPDRIRRNLFATSLLPRSQSVDAQTPGMTRSPRRRNSTDMPGSGSGSLLERKLTTKNGKTKSAEAIQCDYAVCSGKNCGFMFCIKCLCEYHPNSVCKDLAPNSPSKEDEPAHNVACSKQSRRSLMRLRK